MCGVGFLLNKFNKLFIQSREKYMGIQPTIISYRSQTDQFSHFLNVEDLLKSDNSEKIKKIYNDILCSVTAYDPNHVKSLVNVENKLYDRIATLEIKRKEEIQNKNTGWKAFCLSFLTLGIRPLILLIKKQSIQSEIDQIGKTHKKFLHAFNQMKYRRVEKELHPKLKVMKELEKSQLSDLGQELIRLKSIPRIATSLEKVNKKLSKRHQVAFGRSIELREKLNDTHYVINHGQNLELMLVNTIARKLKQEFEPQYYESFEPLRHDTALSHIKEDTHTVAWYQNQISKGRTNDHGLRKQLLCGDCVLESTKPYESALDFFAGSTNIANRDGDLTFRLLLTIVQDYIPDQRVASKLCRDLVKLMNRCPRGGNLYSICVPKEKFDESCYFSKPYGVPLKNQEELRGKIDKMQSGEDPSGYPQIRVLTHKIRPEDGYHVIMNSTLASDQLSKIDDEVSLCIQAALTGYRVQKSPERIFG